MLNGLCKDNEEKLSSELREGGFLGIQNWGGKISSRGCQKNKYSSELRLGGKFSPS